MYLYSLRPALFLLGVNKVTYDWSYTNTTYATEFKNWALQASSGAYFGMLNAGWVSLVFGYKYSNSDGCFFIARGNGESGIELFGHFTNGDFVFDN